MKEEERRGESGWWSDKNREGQEMRGMKRRNMKEETRGEREMKEKI